MLVTLKNVRISYAHIWTAKPYAKDPTSKPTFSCNAMLPPDHPSLAEVRAAINEVAKAKWGAKAAAILKTIEAKDDSALHNGDLKSETEGYAGNFYLSARNLKRPAIVDRNPKNLLVEADGRPYSGCYANVAVDIWIPADGQRVNCALIAVQFVKDGDSWTGGPAINADAFEDLGDGADADDLV